jgi:hypothetical protein
VNLIITLRFESLGSRDSNFENVFFGAQTGFGVYTPSHPVGTTIP